MPIKDKFNPRQIDLAPGLVDRLVFNPLKLGSQFYPGITSRQISQFLLKSISAAQRGLHDLGSGPASELKEFKTCIQTDHRIGLDAIVPAPTTGTLPIPELLRLSDGYSSAFAPAIRHVAVVERTDDLDPFFMFLAARFVQSYFRRDDQVPEAPRWVLYDADVTSQPGPLFQSAPEPKAETSVLLLTPAQRAHIKDLLGLSPRVRFETMLAPKLSLKPHSHPKGLDRALLKAVAAPALTLGGAKG